MGRLLFGGLFYSVVSVFVFVAMAAPLAGRIFLFIFLLPFVGAPAFVVTGSGWGVLVALILYAIIFWTLARSKWARERREKSGSSGWFGSGGGSSGGWSGSGGGFSGGGGSFGGGGASGSW